MRTKLKVPEKVTFSSLGAGAAFTYHGRVYLKVASSYDKDNAINLTATSVPSGVVYDTFSCHTAVTSVEIELVEV